MKKYSLFILTILVFAACEQYFVPDIEMQDQAYVFEGMLTDIEGSHVIKISKTLTVNEDKYDEAATNFSVFIESKDGNVFDMREKYPGKYHTRAFQKGKIGQQYRMHAISPDGEEYYSEWEVLQKAAPIDSIYGEYEIKEVLQYNEAAGYYSEYFRGVNILCNTQTEGASSYYRYEYNVVYFNLQMYPTSPVVTYYYIARPMTSENIDFVSVVNSNVYNSNSIVGHVLGFIDDRNMFVQMPIPEIEMDDAGEVVFDASDIEYSQQGFLMKIKQYSLSEQGFRFWDAIDKQKQASGQMFDPVQSQIIGNVYCQSDSTEKVFGCFNACTISEKYAFIFLSGSNRIVTRSLSSFPDVVGNYISTTQPYFWEIHK